ncbi:lipopolysaccharide biosynthesis protein [Pseudoduganella danionis]|uniref:lipopolysaccharide biosynthesis protein n=1 Tax=Pseudoduganella danionis TaxID=1890295 RepID=UPI0035B079D6
MGLGRRSVWLVISQMVELGLQVILPVILVRHLTMEAFGDYRLLWLIAAGCAGMLPMGMPDTLALFLPKSKQLDQQRYVAVTAAYMLLIGIVSGIGVAAAMHWWGPTEGLRALAGAGALFTVLWVSGGMIDYLPVADERGDWQARAVIALAILRTVLAGAAAYWYGSVVAVFYMLAVVAGVRLCLIWNYARKHHHLGHTAPTRWHWQSQSAQAMPLGLSSLLISVRRQADQWIAAALFGTVQFAVFSLGAVFGSLVLMMRRAISSTFMPSMSKHEASGDWHAVIDTNNRANLIVAFFAVPVLAFIWCFGEPIYTLIYTSTYVGAVPVMRILVVSWLLQIVELNSLVLLAGQMRYSARISGPLLLVSLVISFVGGYTLGLVGAASGGVIMAVLERSLILRKLASSLQWPLSKLQAWGSLLSMITLCWGLAALGRLGYEYRPASIPPLVGMILTGVIIALPYLLIARKRGWLPHKIIPAPVAN